MNDLSEATHAIQQEMVCTGCGAMLKFKPGTQHLSCEYCGAKNEILVPPESKGEVKENNLLSHLNSNLEKEEKVEVAAVKCDGCGATSTLKPGVSSDNCPFCESSLIIKSGSTAKMVKPQYVLPFKIESQQAQADFKNWLKKLWFAPSDLKHYGDRTDKLTGMYLPYWTFDCTTDTSYVGQRGINYQAEEPYMAIENGKSVQRTKTVTKTRWTNTSGNVANSFDDLLVEGTKSLPMDKLRTLEPWDVKSFIPYDDRYLSGFKTETYSVNLKEAYQEAKHRMDDAIVITVQNDIGGDRQIINYKNTSFNKPTFKHVLMPVWLSVYRYNNKLYQFMINARTGEVQGERPYSTGKIILAVLGVIIFIVLMYLFSSGSR